MNTKDIFCANEQTITPHTLAVDGNSEVVATCGCGRFLKFDVSTNDEFNTLVADQENANKGQVSVASQEELLATITDTPVEAVN